jgi:hypothetical protein
VHTWIALGIVLGVVRSLIPPLLPSPNPTLSLQAVVNSVIVFVWTDFVWAASAIYLSVALAYKHEDKPPQVFVRPLPSPLLQKILILGGTDSIDLGSGNGTRFFLDERGNELFE